VERILEPELMDEAEQAAAYAAADFAEPNQGFVDRFLALAPQLHAGAVVDLGCGPADICVRLARARPGLRITGVDGAAAMLACGRAAVAAAGLSERIRLVQARLPGVLPGQRFDAVLSNSLLHHLPDPQVLWAEVARLGSPGAAVLVVDLARPGGPEAARALVERHAAGEPELLRRDFLASLRAAFTAAEVAGQVAAAGLRLDVAPITDRHLAVWGRMS
jgi:ubiquinone/menaquinone biosynthesis C-methylase UbiE